MNGRAPSQDVFVGREAELGKMRDALNAATAGTGSTLVVSGEPGIGKTKLLEEFKNYINGKEVKILSGAASADLAHPFLIFSRVLENETDRPIFEEQEFKLFAKVFAINRAGLLLAQASSDEEEMDADIFAGMLSAVQDFVRDSFGDANQPNAGLGRLEYGDMKVIIEHGDRLFLTAVFSGTEHKDMKKMLTSTVNSIEENFGTLLQTWNGKMDDMAPVQNALSSLARTRFLVKKNLEGVKLDIERIKIATQILEILIEKTKEESVALILEDLHWADESSLFVLNYLARNVRGEKILILGTARPEENPHFQKFIEKMMAENFIDDIPLENLDMVSVASLVNRLYAPNDFHQRFLERLGNECAGNPFFVIELLRQMHDDGTIKKDNGRFVLTSEEYTVPGTVEAVVHRRLEGLDPETMAIAEFASCIGRRFDRAMAMSCQTLKNPEISLEKLLIAGLIDTKNGMAEFNHALFHETIYQGISPRWKSAHHKSLGEYYERFYSEKIDDVLYELAKHFSRSSEHQKSVDYCVRAGEKAEVSYAVEQASRYYERAVDTMKKLPPGKVVPDAEKDLLKRIGQLYYLGGIYDRALETFEIILNLSQDREEKAEMRRKRSSTYEKKGDYTSALNEVGEGEKLADPSKAEHWRLLAERGWILMRESKFAESIEISGKALENLRRFEKTEYDQTHALNALGACNWYRGNLKEALGYYEESERMFEKMNDLNGMGVAYNNLGLVYKDMGDLEKALEISIKSLEIREKVGDIHGIAASNANIGIIYNGLNRLDEALAHHKKCLEICEKLGMLFGIGAAHNNLGTIYEGMGDLDQALKHYGKSQVTHIELKDNYGIAGTELNLCIAKRWAGNLPEAKKHAEKAIEIASKFDFKDIICEANINLSQIYLVLGLNHEAEEAVGESVKIASEAGMKQMVESAHMVVARILAAKGDLKNADKTFKEVLTAQRALEAGTDIAITEYHYGVFLLSGDEKSRGRALVEKAKLSFSNRSRALWVRKCEEILNTA
jgi:predicted ATPase